jgi:hypothetical protein
VKAQLVVETFAFALDRKDFFLDGDLGSDVVVASEDVGSLNVDAQVGDIAGVLLKVSQEHAPVRRGG